MEPAATTKKAARQKAHMYNYRLLADAHFWKEFLSGGSPRVTFNFGGQSIIVDARFAQTAVTWPSIPNDVKPFTNLVAPDDLFTSAHYFRLVDDGKHRDAELDLVEYEDIERLADSEL